MSETALDLRSFGVAFGEHVVLADVTLALAPTGITALLGPAGSGKSTLLRTVAGLNDAHPALRTWGEARVGGVPMERSSGAGELRRGVSMVLQHARFFVDSVRENLASALPHRSQLARREQTELVRELLVRHGLAPLGERLDDDVTRLSTPMQRRLAVVRALACEPLMLLADEPTAGLPPEAADDVLQMLREFATRGAVLWVTHNQRHARAAGGMVALLAGGVVQERATTEAFFDAPQSAAGASFVRTGGCLTPTPGTRREHLRPSTPAPAPLPPGAEATSSRLGPRGFFWVQPGRLGGVPRPGIVEPVERDLDALQRLGITTLVTLEEQPTVPSAALARRGIRSVHFPIADMAAPALEAAAQLCARLGERLDGGEVVALHCRAGLGRTGTMLAAQLVHSGEAARDALERVRRINPSCVQSLAQVEFLSIFDSYLRARRGGAARGVMPMG